MASERSSRLNVLALLKDRERHEARLMWMNRLPWRATEEELEDGYREYLTLEDDSTENPEFPVDG